MIFRKGLLIVAFLLAFAASAIADVPIAADHEIESMRKKGIKHWERIGVTKYSDWYYQWPVLRRPDENPQVWVKVITSAYNVPENYYAEKSILSLQELDCKKEKIRRLEVIYAPLQHETKTDKSWHDAAPDDIEGGLIEYICSEADQITKPEKQGKVTWYADGDSFKFRYKGGRDECRMLGYNAPEWNEKGPPSGAEAKAKLKGMLNDTIIIIKAEKRDRYKRLICDVFLEDGTHVNKVMRAWLEEQGYKDVGKYDWMEK